MQVRVDGVSTLALKPIDGVNLSPNRVYQWLHKNRKKNRKKNQTNSIGGQSSIKVILGRLLYEFGTIIWY